MIDHTKYMEFYFRTGRASFLHYTLVRPSRQVEECSDSADQRPHGLQDDHPRILNSIAAGTMGVRASTIMACFTLLMVLDWRLALNVEPYASISRGMSFPNPRWGSTSHV